MEKGEVKKGRENEEGERWRKEKKMEERERE